MGKILHILEFYLRVKGSLINVFKHLCLGLLQDELRPEYEEALQEKKAKMKAQAKKKVFLLVFMTL